MVLGLLLAIIAAQTVRELLRALAVAGASTDPVPIMTACAVMIVGSAGVGGAQPGLFVTVALLGIAVYGIARVAPLPGFIVWVLTAAGVVVYVGAPFAALVLIRVEAEGFVLLAWTLLIIALTDVAAMFGGVLFGRTQIVPRISASKTLEGTLAGLAGALVGAALVRFALPAATTAVYYGSATLVAAAAFAGDLFASAIKRAAGIKEFGAILPGHGGILDRVDSLLFGAPVAYALAPLLRA
jgi:phosphatidate cytidylyltransferase